jgi:hypothetical protein
MRAFATFLFLTLLCIGSHSSTHAFVDGDTLPPPEFIKSKKGVSLYERHIDIGKDRPARELSLKLTVNTPIEEVARFIKKGQKITDWNDHIREFEAFDYKGELWHFYMRYAVPWPFNDQDVVLKHQMVRSPNKQNIEIHFESVEHPHKPEFKNIDRMAWVKGKWKLEKVSEHTTHVTYIITSSRSKVPAWIIDPFVRKAFLDSMYEFSKMLDKGV